mmetsp:Transcript_19812/g.19817  ORF Transcript_19812/g.19817 Transcript_19812/m.19817 type:complete len:233 (+) Transcript_19812:43-741(+)
MAVRRKVNIHTTILSASLNYNDTSAFMASSPVAQKSPRLRSHLKIKILPHKQPDNLNRSVLRPSKLTNSYHFETTERSSSAKRYITSQGLSSLLSKRTNLPIVDRNSSRPFSALSSAGYMIKDFRKKNNGNIGNIQIKNKLIKNEFRVKVMQKVERIVLRDLNNAKGKFSGISERGYETEKSKIINLIAVPNSDDIENHFDNRLLVESPDKQKYTLESESPSPSYAPRYEKF